MQVHQWLVGVYYRLQNGKFVNITKVAPEGPVGTTQEGDIIAFDSGGDAILPEWRNDGWNLQEAIRGGKYYK